MNILITGSNGYIGRNLARLLKHNNLFLGTRQNLNLFDNLDSFFADKYFDTIIHCATSGGSRLQSDDKSWVYENCFMINNIMKHSDRFGKLIHFGSGAELDRSRDINGNDVFESFPLDPYGMSKNFIAKSFHSNQKFYNLRIFNVFNEDELETRMVRGNILKYINHKDIIIQQNKYMDFLHMDDLFNIVNHYLHNSNLPRIVDCCYKEKSSLLEIANIINNLDKHKCDIRIEFDGLSKRYCGDYSTISKLNINLSNLKDSIQKTYSNMIV